jgi:endonuclease III
MKEDGCCQDKAQTQYKLEYKILFSLVVAGKSAKFAEAVMGRLFAAYPPDAVPCVTPFEAIRRMIATNFVQSRLRGARSGNYGKLEKAFKALVEADFDLRLCTHQDLEKIPGIGPKTSRFFILWTRPDAQVAALDTHILKWMNYLGHTTIKSTPTGKKYEELEKWFLVEAALRNIKPAKLDYMVWEWCKEGYHKEGWPTELEKDYTG